MNPEAYARKVVTAEPASSAPGFFAVVIRSGYPIPQYGVEIFIGPRGKVSNSIDWSVDRLQDFVADTVESVAEECASVVAELNLDEVTRNRIANAIRRHFEIDVH